MPIANGIVYTPENIDGHAIINGVPATEHNGLHLVQGSRIIESAGIAFPGWTELDTNTIITVDDAAVLDAVWTIDGTWQGAGNDHYAYCDAGSAYWTGDFELRIKVTINFAGTSIIQTHIGLQEVVDQSVNFLGSSRNVINLYVTEGGGTALNVQSNEWQGGAQNAVGGQAAASGADGVPVYCKLYRTGTNFGVKAYFNDATFTDPADATAEDSLDGSVVAYRYIYAFNPLAGGAPRTYDGEIQIISIDPSPFA